jgi:hypothetical protein
MTSFDSERKALVQLKSIYEERLKEEGLSTGRKVKYKSYLLNVNIRIEELDLILAVKGVDLICF